MTELNLMADAMEHAKNIDDFKLVILCKGLGFQRVDATDIETLRVKLLEHASKKPVAYMDAVKNGIVHTEGFIVNSIDRGVLKLEKIHGIRQWIWTAGDREGENVGGQITNPTQDAKAFVKTFILNNIHTYNVVLRSITDNLNAQQKAKAFFKKQNDEESEEGVKTIGEELPDYLREVNQQTDSLPALPTSFAEARDYIAERGYPKLPAKVKVFNDAVQDGSVTKDNAGVFLRELFKEE